MSTRKVKMNFKINLTEDTIKECGILIDETIRESRGVESAEFKMATVAAIILGVLALFVDAELIKITKVRETKKKK